MGRSTGRQQPRADTRGRRLRCGSGHGEDREDQLSRDAGGTAGGENGMSVRRRPGIVRVAMESHLETGDVVAVVRPAMVIGFGDVEGDGPASHRRRDQRGQHRQSHGPPGTAHGGQYPPMRSERLKTSGDRRDQHDSVAVLDRRVEALQEADVLVVQEDVHEAVELALARRRAGRAACRGARPARAAPRQRSRLEARRSTRRPRGRAAASGSSRSPCQRGLGGAQPPEGSVLLFLACFVSSVLCVQRVPARSAARGKSSAIAAKASSFASITGASGSRPSWASSVLSPLPVMQTTIDSSFGIRPDWISLIVAASVVPPAGSVQMPSVLASSLIASTISRSVAELAPAAGVAARPGTRSTVGRVADRDALGDRVAASAAR